MEVNNTTVISREAMAGEQGQSYTLTEQRQNGAQWYNISLMYE